MLFLALLVLNLAFFGWARWIDGPPEAAPLPASAPGVAALQLAPLPEAAAVATVSTRCRSIGPFADASAAASAAELLHANGWTASERTAESSTPDGYWVYITDLADAAAQRSAMARLAGAGIRDAAPVPQSNHADRISVGVFDDQMHAVRRAEQVRQLGFKPVLDVHQRTVSQAWLDVALKPDDADPAPAQFTNPGGAAEPAVTLTDCPSKGASG
jgi:hypothetical protein